MRPFSVPTHTIRFEFAISGVLSISLLNGTLIDTGSDASHLTVPSVSADDGVSRE